MSTLLHIQASPRDGSVSHEVAREFLDAFWSAHPQWTIEALDLFEHEIPAFTAPEARAKYAVLAGKEPEDDDARAWKEVIEVIDQFKRADVLLLSTPMWNFSIPYRLKQYIDVIVQPGLTFNYSPDTGYEGLVTGRPARLILARGGDYSTDETAAMDMQKSYLELVLGFIGFTDIHSVVVEPTLLGGPEVAEQKIKAASAEARSIAAGL